MKIPERVSIAVAKLLANLCGCDAVRGKNEPESYIDSCVSFAAGCQCRADADAAIIAGLEEWIASGEASLKYGAFTPNGGYHYTSLTDDRSHPVLIIRMEQK